jgi:hypothetical protein
MFYSICNFDELNFYEIRWRGITGFAPYIINAISCIVKHIRKAWIFYAILRFPVAKCESTMIAVRFSYPINLKRQPCTQTKNPNVVLIRIECRVYQELNVGRNGEFLCYLQAIE